MMILVKQKYSSDHLVSCLPQKEARHRCGPVLHPAGFALFKRTSVGFFLFDLFVNLTW